MPDLIDGEHKTPDFPIQPEAETKAKRGRKPGKPNAKAVYELVEGALISANLAASPWAAGHPERELWILTTQEIVSEAEAISAVLLSYPWLYKWLTIGTGSGPLLKLFVVQWMVFGKRFQLYREMVAEQTARTNAEKR